MIDIGTILFAEQQRAERAIAVLRGVMALILIAGFALLFANIDAWSDPVLGRQLSMAAATMVLFLGAGLVSWFLAAPGRYRAWFPWAFATFDLVLVMANLYGSHWNTGTPGNYTLILPSAWMIPLILAYGALRFNPAMQTYIAVSMLAGLLVVSGSFPWVVAAVEPVPASIGPTYDIQTNVMRWLMLGSTAFVLTAAAARARQLLRRAIGETVRRENLTRYLPAELAPALSEQGLEAVTRGKRQRVAVLFVDLQGFTTRAEAMSPEDLSAFVAAFRDRVGNAAERHGGVIDKYIGDAVMLLFGVPKPRDDDAARALACARAILDEVADWSQALTAAGEPPVGVGIGISYGEVFSGAIGDRRRLEYTVLGDSVNIAARLEPLTRGFTTDLLVTEDLLTAAGEDRACWEALPDMTVRGRGGPVQAYGLRPRASR